MARELTEKDRTVLISEKRMGYVFLGMILAFGGLFNLVYFIMNKTEQNYLLIAIIDIAIISFAYLICNRVNHKINLDLKDNQKEVLKRSVDTKSAESSYEAGSGVLFIPILGNLFPKLWGQKMRETKKYFIFASGNKYEVDEGIYNDFKEGDDFYIHFAKHSDTNLSYSKK